MNNQILTSSDIKDTAKICRSIARDISTTRIPKLQAELKELRDHHASTTSIAKKLEELNDANSAINKNLTNAIDLDNKAIIDILTSTDVVNAKAALICSTAKVKLAVARLDETRSVLKFVAAFIELVAAIATAVPTAGISFANIKSIIEKIDALSKTEFLDGLSDEEREKLKSILKNCLPDNGG